jgi:hypothetical protein
MQYFFKRASTFLTKNVILKSESYSCSAPFSKQSFILTISLEKKLICYLCLLINKQNKSILRCFVLRMEFIEHMKINSKYKTACEMAKKDDLFLKTFWNQLKSYLFTSALCAKLRFWPNQAVVSALVSHHIFMIIVYT